MEKRKVGGLILTGASLAGMASTAATTTSAGFIDFLKNIKDGASSGIDMIKDGTSKGLGMLKTGVSKLKDIAAEHPVISSALLGVTGICFIAGYFYKKLSNSGNEKVDVNNSENEVQLTEEKIIDLLRKMKNYSLERGDKEKINKTRVLKLINDHDLSYCFGEKGLQAMGILLKKVTNNGEKPINKILNMDDKTAVRIIVQLFGYRNSYRKMEILFGAQTGNREFVIDKILKTGKNAASIIEQLFKYKTKINKEADNFRDVSDKSMEMLFKARTSNNEFVIDEILKKDDEAADIIGILIENGETSEEMAKLFEEKYNQKNKNQQNVNYEDNIDEKKKEEPLTTGEITDLLIKINERKVEEKDKAKIDKTPVLKLIETNKLFFVGFEKNLSAMKTLLETVTGNGEKLIDKILKMGDEIADSIIRSLFLHNKADEFMNVLFKAKIGEDFIIDKILENSEVAGDIIYYLSDIDTEQLEKNMKVFSKAKTDKDFVINKILQTGKDAASIIKLCRYSDQSMDLLFNAKTKDGFVIDKILNRGGKTAASIIKQLIKNDGLTQKLLEAKTSKDEFVIDKILSYSYYTDDIADIIKQFFENEELTQKLFATRTSNNEFVIEKILYTYSNAASIIEQLSKNKELTQKLLETKISKDEFVIDKILNIGGETAASIIEQLFKDEKLTQKLLEAKTDNDFVINKILGTGKDAASIIEQLSKNKELTQKLLETKTSNNEFVIDKILNVGGKIAASIIQSFRYSDSVECMKVLLEAKTGNNDFVIDKILEKSEFAADIIENMLEVKSEYLKECMDVWSKTRIGNDKFVINKILEMGEFAARIISVLLYAGREKDCTNVLFVEKKGQDSLIDRILKTDKMREFFNEDYSHVLSFGEILKTGKNADSIVDLLLKQKDSEKPMEVLFKAYTPKGMIIKNILKQGESAASIIEQLFKWNDSDKKMEVLFKARTGNGCLGDGSLYVIDKILETGKNAASIIEQLFKDKEKMRELFTLRTESGERVIDKILETNDKLASIIEQLFKGENFKERLKALSNTQIDNQSLIDKILAEDNAVKLVEILFSNFSEEAFKNVLYNESTFKNLLSLNKK